MKFIFWTLFLSVAAVIVLVILVGIFIGREYHLNRDPNNPRNAGQTDMTINRDNAGAILFLGVLGVGLSLGAIRNWRAVLWPINTDREINE